MSWLVWDRNQVYCAPWIDQTTTYKLVLIRSAKKAKGVLRAYCPNIYTVGHIEHDRSSISRCACNQEKMPLYQKKRVIGICTCVGGKFMNTLTVLSLHQLKKWLFIDKIPDLNFRLHIETKACPTLSTGQKCICINFSFINLTKIWSVGQALVLMWNLKFKSGILSAYLQSFFKLM